VRTHAQNLKDWPRNLGSGRIADYVLEPINHGTKSDAEHGGKEAEFHEVQTAMPRLIFRHEGLGHSKSMGDLLLRHAALKASLAESGCQREVCW
jgi:hypothetical protein